MIAADQWRAYNEAVEEIRSAAAEAVEREVSDWIAEEWDGDVASAREAAKRIMASQVAEHDRRAAALAAEWYDAQGREAGSRLDRAVTAVTYTKHDVDNLARYQATKLAGDTPDVGEFARMCGEFAANDAMRSLNGTILRNAKRDRDKGVRFARVTSGRNTCAFCLMLAGRGAVYHTRKTAGEFDHWHRHCTCKVVPCFSGNQHEVLVEGHDPRDAKRWSDRIEAAKRTRKGIPGFPDDVKADCERLNRSLAESWAAYLDGGKSVESYRENYASLVESTVPENPIRIEDFVKLEGKELQESIWLAKTGHRVVLRNPDIHLRADGNTSDALVDGMTCDYKRIASASLKKAVREVTGKLERQGPSFTLDLTVSKIGADEARVRMVMLLDDPKIEVIHIVTGNGSIETIKK